MDTRSRYTIYIYPLLYTNFSKDASLRNMISFRDYSVKVFIATIYCIIIEFYDKTNDQNPLKHALYGSTLLQIVMSSRIIVRSNKYLCKNNLHIDTSLQECPISSLEYSLIIRVKIL